ncbi:MULTISPECIES: ABC transporter ATP-binding protein [Haloferax]|nr:MULTISPECIES: ABC transporter ATP-binding protein [Haloferax]
MAKTLVKAEGLSKHFPVETGLLERFRGNQQYVHAVDGIDIEIKKGEIFGLAGESGCGKTTTGHCLMRLSDPTAGEIYFGDQQRNIAQLEGTDLKKYRRDVQMVFQDPYESINDRFTVRKWVREPLTIHDIGTREEKENRVWEALDQCGLKPVENFIDKYPHELSGGQRQRVSLARAMVLRPKFIVADEPTSMLDVSVRAGVLRVFKELAEEHDVSILYISHDLSLLRYICDRIGIMYQGEMMEVGEANAVLQNPKHPYTQTLLKAVPRVDSRNERNRVRISGEVNERIGGIQGCAFKDRCQYRFDRCDDESELLEVGKTDDHEVSCHLHDEEVEKPIPVYEG